MNLRDPLRFVKSRFLREAGTLQISAVLNQASQIVSSVAVAFLLGARGQGLFFLAVTLQALLYNLVNVGVVQATVTQVAAASVRDSRVKVAGWLAFLVKSYLVFSAALIGGGYFVLPRLAEWWFSAKVGREEAWRLGEWAWWLTFWPLLDLPRAVAQVAFQGTRRMLALGQLDNGTELIRMFLVTVGALLSGSAEGAVLGEIASRVLGSYLALDMYKSARRDGGAWLPSMRDVFARAPEIPFLQGIRLGLRVGLMRNGHTLFMSVLPPLVIGAQAGSASVAYFKVASKIMGLPLMMLQGVSRTVLPALSELRGLRDLARFRTLYNRTALLSGAFITLSVLVVLPAVKPLVSLFYPRDYAAPVLLYAAILALGTIPSAFAVGLESFYILTDQMKASLMITLAGALVTIPLNVLLIVRLPEIGIAWGLVLYQSWTLVHFAYVAHYFRHRAHAGHWDR